MTNDAARTSTGPATEPHCALLLLLAIPLFWSGSALGAAGGSLLSVLALLACPLGMYFMMRAMGGMQHGGSRGKGESRERQTPPSAREGGR